MNRDHEVKMIEGRCADIFCIQVQPSMSSGTLSADAEDAECLLTARRDNYVARTFSHMARARLDHAVSRSADLELLKSEKWEMRCASHQQCDQCCCNGVPYQKACMWAQSWSVLCLDQNSLALLLGPMSRPKRIVAGMLSANHRQRFRRRDLPSVCADRPHGALCRFADDGPCTLSQSGASKEGAISQAKRMMSEAATAQASIFMRGEGTDQR